MKKPYFAPQVELILLDDLDILTMSTVDDEAGGDPDENQHKW